MNSIKKRLIILLFSLLLSSVPFFYPISLLAANQGDQFEPDDTYAEAEFVSIDPDQTVTLVDRTFHKFFDEDWIQFTALLGHTYDIAVEVRNSNIECDPVIELYAGDGTTSLIRVNTKGPGEKESLIWTSPSDGKYYIRFLTDGIYYGPSVIYDVTIYASELFPPPAYIHGKVTSNGVGIKGVIFKAGSGAGVSLSDGSYIIGLTPDENGTEFNISMQKDGYQSKSFTQFVEPLGSYQRDVELLQISEPNQSPKITGTPEEVIIVNGLYSFRPIATDPENDSLSFSITNKPSWLNFNPENGMLLGVPNKNHIGKYESITITVRDSRGASSHLPSFMIEVQDAAPLSGVLMLLLK